MKIYQPSESLSLYHASALDVYDQWETPISIVSDGAYGIGGFPGDPPTSKGLKDWYLPHVKAWSMASISQTTLWFWNTELGWASVHPILEEYGWKYVSCNTWDKGMAHVAGNCNTQTLRHFPKVTEVCVQYARDPLVVKQGVGTSQTFQDWLVSEWTRSGLPFSEANNACQVKNAASRKYLTSGTEWYPPPREMLEKMERYLNERGDPSGAPYMDLDEINTLDGSWDQIRSTFHCEAGITNVWRHPSPGGTSRFQYGNVTHPNQKPLALVSRIIKASSEEGDTIWEPFAGTAPSALVSFQLNRNYFGAEISDEYYSLAETRIANETLDNKVHGPIKIEGLLSSFLND